MDAHSWDKKIVADGHALNAKNVTSDILHYLHKIRR